MPLTIDDPETERLAADLAQRTGETVAEAIAKALRERLERIGPPPADQERLVDSLMAISDEIAALPDIDGKPPDEIIGYDEHGGFLIERIMQVRIKVGRRLLGDRAHLRTAAKSTFA